MDLLVHALPNWHPRHVFKDIIPALKEAGVTDDKIDMMMVENPRRLFAGE
jgi:phosphotriesterase-related protein